MNLLLRIILLLATVVGALSVVGIGNAGQIVWSSERMARNLDSAGREIGDAFRFELGCFKDGFAPSATNTADWASHWIGVGEAPYKNASGSFAASTIVG